MDTLELARRDAAHIIREGGFETEIVFVEQSGEVTLKGTVTHHNFSIGEDGQAVDSKNVHATVNESDLNEAGIITRNADKDIALRGKILRFADSAQVVSTWSVRRLWPTRTFGHIVLILGKHE